MEQLTVLGVRQDHFTKFETIEVDPNVEIVTFKGSEFTALCPVTSQPDFYRISIEFSPRGRSLESKTLKLYLQRYRQLGLFAEAIAALICEELRRVLDPEWLHVELKQRRRGGLALTVVSAYTREQLP